MLSDTLRQLTEDGLVSRTAYAEVPPPVEYALTPLSSGLIDIVKQLIGRVADHHDEIHANRSHHRLLHVPPPSRSGHRHPTMRRLPGQGRSARTTTAGAR